MEIPSGGADRISSVHKITQFKGLNARRATWFAGHFLFVTGQKKPRPGAGALGLGDSDETLSLKGNLFLLWFSSAPSSLEGRQSRFCRGRA
jgi:hypothetical protein